MRGGRRPWARPPAAPHRCLPPACPAPPTGGRRGAPAEDVESLRSRAGLTAFMGRIGFKVRPAAAASAAAPPPHDCAMPPHCPMNAARRRGRRALPHPRARAQVPVGLQRPDGLAEAGVGRSVGGGDCRRGAAVLLAVRQPFWRASSAAAPSEFKLRATPPDPLGRFWSTSRANLTAAIKGCRPRKLKSPS